MMQSIKRCLYATLLCTVVGNVWADTAAPAEKPLDLTKPLIINKNQTQIVIRLTANATTGFKWFLKDYNAAYLTPTEHHYLPPQNTKLMGAPGTETFTFHVNQKAATVPQTGTIHFVYARPWEPIPDTETVVTWVRTYS